MDWVEFNASNNLVVKGTEISPQAKNQWEYTSKTFTTDATTTSLVIRLIAGESAMGNVFADGIQLIKVSGGASNYLLIQ
jgi:hypothetical protein